MERGFTLADTTRQCLTGHVDMTQRCRKGRLGEITGLKGNLFSIEQRLIEMHYRVF